MSSETDLSKSRVAVWADSRNELAERLDAHVVVVETPDLDAILDVAEGQLDAVIDTSGKPWDHAPYTILIEEAGGRYSNVKGGRRIDLGEVRYTNRRIHQSFIALLDRLR